MNRLDIRYIYIPLAKFCLLVILQFTCSTYRYSQFTSLYFIQSLAVYIPCHLWTEWNSYCNGLWNYILGDVIDLVKWPYSKSKVNMLFLEISEIPWFHPLFSHYLWNEQYASWLINRSWKLWKEWKLISGICENVYLISEHLFRDSICYSVNMENYWLYIRHSVGCFSMNKSLIKLLNVLMSITLGMHMCYCFP